jgi:hypothetical protein
MHKPSHILIALYDALPEHEHFLPEHRIYAHGLGTALGKSGFGVIARVGSPLISTTFGALSDLGVASIALSPANSHTEHEIAYRLPHLTTPMIFTGRGAYGTDTITLSSAQALAVLGSHPEILENILEHTKDHTMPILVLTNEEPDTVRDRVRGIHPAMVSRLIISDNPETLVSNLSAQMRRVRFGGQL